jgi:hypothetical protein
MNPHSSEHRCADADLAAGQMTICPDLLRLLEKA